MDLKHFQILCNNYFFALFFKHKMSRLDKTITRITGRKNYMQDLSSVTGNLESIDKNYYTDRIKSVKHLYGAIVMELSKYTKNKKIQLVLSEIEKSFVKLNLEELYTNKVTKSGKTKCQIRLRPKMIYESEWFTKVKKLEDDSVEISKQFDIESVKLNEAQLKTIIENPDTVENFTFYGEKINEENVCQTVYIICSYVGKILDILLSPMYDCKKFIEKHWMEQIDSALQKNVEGGENMAREDAQQLVYTFVLAKYRTTIVTGSDQLTKVFLDIIPESKIMEMDPGRFMNVIEAFDMKDVQGKDKVLRFTNAVRAEIEKVISNKDITPAEIFKDINDIMSIGEKDEEDEEVEYSDVEDTVFS